MKKIFIISILTTFLFADSFQDRFTVDIQRLTKTTIEKQENLQKQETKNQVYNRNQIINSIEKRNLPDLIIKKPKKINIFVRKSYTYIGDKIIVANPASYKTIIIKQKQDWEF